LLAQKSAIRDSLSRAGANEVLTYSFVHSNLIDKASQKREQAYKISNALSPDLQYYRLSALPSLLDKVHPNIKAGYDEFALFELSKAHGTGHTDADGLPLEFEDIDLVYASKRVQPGAAFYHAKRYLLALAEDMDVTLTFSTFGTDPEDPITDPYDLSRSAEVIVDGQTIGIVGEFKASVKRSLKLPPYCAGFSISQTKLLKSRSQNSHYQALPRFPKVEQDVCLRVADQLPYATLEELVTRTLTSSKPQDTTYAVNVIDIYQAEGADYKQITFRVSLVSFERTLTDQEMTKLLQSVADAAAEAVDAERV
ncbi:MAG TPA: hypothetical protein VGE30_01660, partial [Candidatus Saccharimonadales bacterium]